MLGWEDSWKVIDLLSDIDKYTTFLIAKFSTVTKKMRKLCVSFGAAVYKNDHLLEQAKCPP